MWDSKLYCSVSGPATDDDRLLVDTIDYQRLYDDMEAAASPENFKEFRAQLEAWWFEMYQESLRAMGYEDDGDLEYYELGTYTYCYNMTMSVDVASRWWASHRDDVRMVVVHGFSTPVTKPRPDSRLRAHKDSYYREWDKEIGDIPFDRGHFMAHTIGGEIDNGIFMQRRDTNRGWRKGLGKIYRAMERYAQLNPGVFNFSRSIYGDGSCQPFFVEYGVLRLDHTWWVEVFPNRVLYKPFRGFPA